jgi:hypothetical protein
MKFKDFLLLERTLFDVDKKLISVINILINEYNFSKEELFLIDKNKTIKILFLLDNKRKDYSLEIYDYSSNNIIKEYENLIKMKNEEIIDIIKGCIE